MSNIRTRFAPSPTGFLHIGNLRGALFAYLLAKSQGGQVVLRIEDTDQKREVRGAVDSLLNILNWIGISFDEGPKNPGAFGPYIQTERLDIYQKYAQELIAKGEAYYCFCSAEHLDQVRKEQQEAKLAPRYNRACRDLSPEEIAKKIKAGNKYVIRQKMPKSGEVLVYDELRGEINFKAEDLEDQVLMKSDGIPTYQLASVVDDHLMEISYVTRGDEWLPSFPKNILLYQSFGWTPPKFIHLPLILNKTGGKLSKRQGAVFVEEYKQAGYLPEALINFCALLGWHPKNDEELLSLDKLETEFDISGLGSSPAVFDLEKLDYLNGYYLRQKSIKELTELCRPYLTKAFNIQDIDERIIALSQERLKKLSDISELSNFFFKKIKYPRNLLIWKNLSQSDVKNNLKVIVKIINQIPKEEWTKTNLEKTIIDYLKANNLKNGDYLWPLRVSLTGAKNSPGPFEVAEILGKEKSLERIKKAIKKLSWLFTFF